MPKALEGYLYGYFETGYEGTYWVFLENEINNCSNTGKSPYDYMHFLEDGDYLEVFKDGKLFWSGVIKQDSKTNKKQSPYNPNWWQQVSCNRWVHWIQEGFDHDEWGKMFFRQYKAKLTKITV